MNSDLYARLAATGKPECPQCGYSLEGLPGPHRCPECGRTYGRDILTWRPTLPRWWMSLVSMSPLLLFMAYDAWTSGLRPFIIVGFLVVLATWASALYGRRIVHDRNHVSFDDCGISYHIGNVERHFEWKKIRSVTHDRFWGMIDIDLRNGRDHRFPPLMPRKDVGAFIIAANEFVNAAREHHHDAASDCDG